MLIETKSASLDTFSVTIQSLHVNGKQMTLAVFRQLPTASAYSDSFSVNENARFWGIVRYSIKDQGDCWAVADIDGVLYRCNVFNKVINSEAALERWIENMKSKIEAWNDFLIREGISKEDEKNYRISVGREYIESDDIDKIIKDIHGANNALIEVQTAKKTRDYLLSLPQLFIAV